MNDAGRVGDPIADQSEAVVIFTAMVSAQELSGKTTGGSMPTSGLNITRAGSTFGVT